MLKKHTQKKAIIKTRKGLPPAFKRLSQVSLFSSPVFHYRSRHTTTKEIPTKTRERYQCARTSLRENQQACMYIATRPCCSRKDRAQPKKNTVPCHGIHACHGRITRTKRENIKRIHLPHRYKPGTDRVYK